MSFKDFFFFSIFSSCNHFLQPSETILAILVKAHKRNIFFAMILKSATDRRGDVVQSFFFFVFFLFCFVLALVAILFSRAKLFSEFW